MKRPQPLSAETLVNAAVSVVLPWSTWPIVPTLQWGLVRRNFSLAMGLSSLASALGAGLRGRGRRESRPAPGAASAVRAGAVPEDEAAGQARRRAGADMGAVAPVVSMAVWPVVRMTGCSWRNLQEIR